MIIIQVNLKIIIIVQIITQVLIQKTVVINIVKVVNMKDRLLRHLK